MTSNTTRRLTGLVLLGTGLPAFSQQKTAMAASAPASQVEPNAVPGSDPIWRVADVGIALVIGLIVGYLIGAWRSGARGRASHA